MGSPDESSGRADQLLSPVQVKSIVLVTHYFPAHRGGVEIVAGELADRLCATGRFRINWYASNADLPPEPRAGLKCVAVASTNVIERCLKLPYPIWSPAIVGSLWRAVRAADAVHLHDFLYCGNLLAFCVAKLQSKPVFVTQHVGSIPYNSFIFRLVHRFANRILGSLVLRNVDQVIFVSAAVRDEFQRFVRFRRTSVLLWNGVDRGVYAPVGSAERERLRSAMGILERSPVYLFVGRFVEKKGLLILRGLAQQFPNIRFLFAGSGPLDPAGWKLGNVTVFRNIQGSLLAQLYHVADLLVLPSKGEGFPLVVQEAMACGTPVLVSTETAAAVAGLDRFVFSEPVLGMQVLERWQRRIRDLAGQGDILCKMRSGVAEFAHAHWDWDACAQSYARLFGAVGGRTAVRQDQSKL